MRNYCALTALLSDRAQAHLGFAKLLFFDNTFGQMYSALNLASNASRNVVEYRVWKRFLNERYSYPKMGLWISCEVSCIMKSTGDKKLEGRCHKCRSLSRAAIFTSQKLDLVKPNDSSGSASIPGILPSLFLNFRLDSE